MNRILEILNEENYEDIELYATTKEELENKVVEYLKEENEEATINDIDSIKWEGKGYYSIAIPCGEYCVSLTSECQKSEFENGLINLQNDVYVVDKCYIDNYDEIAGLDKFSMNVYGKHCISEEEYNYRQELKRRYNFKNDLIEKIVSEQDGICDLEVDFDKQEFYNEYKNYIYLGYEPNSFYYYFLNKDLKTLYYIRSYYDRNFTELK